MKEFIALVLVVSPVVLFVAIYVSLIKIEILLKNKTDCSGQQSVNDLIKEINSFREYQNSRKANCDRVPKD